MQTVRFSRSAASSIFWSQWAYWCTLGIALWAFVYLPAGDTRAILVLSPILPGTLIVAVAYWLYVSCDEYFKSKILRAAALTACVLALGSMVCAFLELLGMPRLSMVYVHGVIWSVFNAQMLWLYWKNR